jgi:hypothetical protein
LAPEKMAHMNCHRNFCLLLLGTVLSFSAGCFSAKPLVPNTDAASAGGQIYLGALALTSSAFGQINLKPNSCSSGGRQFFFGADFEDDRAGAVLRLVIDPLEGPAVRVFSTTKPFSQSVIFRRSDCPVFDFSLDSTGWQINHIKDFRVTLKIECANKDGESLKGTASASHCH